MIKMSLLWICSFCLLGVPVISGSATPQLSQSATNPPNEIIGRVGEVRPEGHLKVRRKTARAETRADLGMPIYKGDVLSLNAPGTAYVRCNDNKIKVLKIGNQGCPCPVNGPPDKWRNVPIPPTRSDNYNIPFIISPRGTRIINSRPTIRWAPVIGATDKTIYTVSIYGEGMSLIWSRPIRGKTKLLYPRHAKALLPGEYIAIVKTDGKPSTDEPQKGLGFIVLDKHQAREIIAAKENIRKSGKVGAPTRVFLAVLYSNKGLYAEAIEQLEGLPKTAKTPTLERMLGDLYVTIGLNGQAENIYAEIEKRYEAALKNPQGVSSLAEDLEGQALIKIALAGIYNAQGKAGVKTKLEEAMRIYEQLGDPASIEAIKREWAEILNSSN